MNIAVFGGSFDPIHKGHLEIITKLFDDFHMDKVIVIPTERVIVGKVFVWDDEENKYSDDYQITKIDLNDKSMSYACGIDEGQEKAFSASQEEWTNFKNMLTSLDSEKETMADVVALRDFGMDNILSYSRDENGVYTFNVMISYVYERDSQDEEFDYSKYVRHYTITVKDGYFQTVDQIVFYDWKCDFVLDANQQKIPDGFGGYETSSDIMYHQKTTATYKYGADVDNAEIEAINAMISKYDGLAKNGQLTEGGLK